MALEKVETARFAVIDMGAPANAYYEISEVVQEDGVQVGQVMKRNAPTTLSDISAALEAFDATVIDANATLEAQNTTLQQRVAELESALQTADAALAAVSAADEAWDTSPRADVMAARQTIAALAV